MEEKEEEYLRNMEDVEDYSWMTKADYDSIPIHYCKNCGSLAIMSMPIQFRDYCDKCGSTETGKASIFAWLDLQ